MKNFGIFIGLILLISACNKEEGPGGFSKISGTLIVKELNKYNQVIKTYPAMAEDIYITYGDNTYFDDDIETSNNGYFQFTNLTAGDYTIWYYSEDTSTITGGGNTFFSKTVAIGKKETISLDTLITFNIRDIDDGTSTITGTVNKINYLYNSSGVYDNDDIYTTSPAAEIDVYIVYEDDDFYFDRIRTHLDGTFTFSNLIKGNYRIYVYSENINGGRYNSDSENVLAGDETADLVLYRDVNIGGDLENKTVEDFYTEKILEIDDGTSSISGKVYLIQYWNSSIPPYDSNDIKDITPAQELEVYIQYGDDEAYYERTRTSYNGIFEFKNLIQGNYRVYVYSKDVSGGIYDSTSENVIFNEDSKGSYDLVIYRDVTITDEYQNHSVSDMYVEDN